MEEFTINNRHKEKYHIVQHLKSVLSEIGFGSACVTNTATILKRFNAEKYVIGQGAFGVAYKINLKLNDGETPIIIKEGRLSENEYSLAKDKIYPKEYLINKAVNNVLKLGLSPNFLFTFAILFCDNCNLRNISYKCSETFMEYMDNDLLSVTDYFVENDTMNTKRSDLMMMSTCFQILSAVDILHRTYGILHNDIKADNVLVKIIPSSDEDAIHYSKYVIEGGEFIPDYTYYIPLINFIPVLSDFGISKILKPSKTFQSASQNTYGTRIKIVNKNKIQKIKIALTRQELKNINLYPPLEFMEDIQDSIQMFTGGKGFRHGGFHAFLGNNKIKDMLEPYITFDKNKVKPNQILTNLLMYDLFTPIFKKPDFSVSIINTFTPYETEDILPDFDNIKL